MNIRKKIFFFLISLLIIFSFVSHDLIPHSHHHSVYGSGLQAVFHGNETKWYMLLLLGYLLIATFFISKAKDIKLLLAVPARISSPPHELKKSFNPINKALKRGIINSKFCD